MVRGMKPLNEDVKQCEEPRPLAGGASGRTADRMAEPKSRGLMPDPKAIKARAMRRPPGLPRVSPVPVDPIVGFAVQEREMLWIGDLLEELTPRQRDVLLECCRGGTSKQIAERMRISQSTLQNHLHAMSLRLGVAGRDSMARLVGVHLLRGYRRMARES